MCTMTYAEVGRQVRFAYEMPGKNEELGELIQRGITSRTEDITKYLLASEHRFLGALVVAAWGGEPEYTELSMDDPGGMLKDLDNGFGVLTFNGQQQYFVLDGQHRLKAIMDATRKDAELLKEDICVLIVTHYNTPEGRVRTRRLFSNINKNAKTTVLAENIALDEDDSFAVLTRRLLDEHHFLKQKGRVRVILSTTDDGGVKLATNSIPKTDSRALTTMTVVYDLLQHLSFDCPDAMRDATVRPLEDVLDTAYSTLAARIDALLENCGDVRRALEDTPQGKSIRAPKGDEGKGHAFLRPIVQRAVARVLSNTIQQRLATWEELMPRLRELNWDLNEAPWTAICKVENNKASMIAGKDHTELLVRLLQAHLAPTSKADINRALKLYQGLRGARYPFSVEELAKRIVPGAPSAGAGVPTYEVKEISDGNNVILRPSVTAIDMSIADDDEVDINVLDEGSEG